MLVINQNTKWNRTISAITDEWFDFVMAWNTKDGIAVKINNKIDKEGKVCTFLFSTENVSLFCRSENIEGF